MTDAKGLLGITISASIFGSSAHQCFSTQMIRANEARVTALDVLAEKLGGTIIEKHIEAGIPIVFRKFKAAVGSSQEMRMKKRELRTLAYALDYSESGLPAILSTASELERALRLITLQWRDGFVTGLLGCYLKNWQRAPKESLRILHLTISSRLHSYAGNRPTYLAMKADLRFFEPSNGDVVLGSEIAIKKDSIAAATKSAALPDSWITYPYFHNVILSFYEKVRNHLAQALPDLETALHAHCAGVKGSWTSLLIISRIIVQANMPGQEGIQDTVKALAFSLVGDPAIKAHWTPPAGTPATDTKDIEPARQILNEWITRQFITVFFETCLDDPRRKAFWLSMAKRVSAFKVFGPASVRATLLRDKRIKDFVGNRYQVSGGSNNVAAILMHVGAFALVEFSDTGWAFYAYQIGSKYCPRLDDYYHSIGQLRNSGLPRLLRRQGRQIYALTDEGSLSHMDGDMMWEEVFRYWIRHKIGEA